MAFDSLAINFRQLKRGYAEKDFLQVAEYGLQQKATEAGSRAAQLLHDLCEGGAIGIAESMAAMLEGCQ